MFYLIFYVPIGIVFFLTGYLASKLIAKRSDSESFGWGAMAFMILPVLHFGASVLRGDEQQPTLTTQGYEHPGPQPYHPQPEPKPEPRPEPKPDHRPDIYGPHNPPPYRPDVRHPDYRPLPNVDVIPIPYNPNRPIPYQPERHFVVGHGDWLIIGFIAAVLFAVPFVLYWLKK